MGRRTQAWELCGARFPRRYVYVLVRADIPLADQIVQVGHACLEAGRRFEQPAESPHLIVLSVPSEAHLYDAIAQAEIQGIRCAVFHEPDDDMANTAACTEPVSGAYRRVFRRYPLWSAIVAGMWARGPPIRKIFGKTWCAIIGKCFALQRLVPFW